MRDKNLLQLFLGLNVALAACFVIYLLVSSSRQPRIAATSFARLTLKTNAAVAPPTLLSGPSPTTNAPPPTNNGPGNLSATNGGPSTATNAANETNVITAAAPVFSTNRIGWEQIEADSRDNTENYKKYLNSLRSVGCPEDKIHYITLTDINELFGKKRLKEAITYDPQWWRTEAELSVTGALQQKGRSLEEERRLLIEKYLGAEAAEAEKGEASLWSNVQLTGPVLGSLPPETHSLVQEICGRSIERHQGAMWARFNEGQPLNAVEMAKLREQTRADLRKVLNSDAMEEFLLRYSHNSHQLRSELRGFETSPDEFRKIFRATDALEHQMQLEYGSMEALSAQQRERFRSQRDTAIKEALGPKRYQDYLLVKDPLYVNAQTYANQYTAPPKAILPLYQMLKANDDRRQKILNDATLTQQQKNEGISAINQEQMRSVQQIVTEARKP